ncbi:hypothetical protein SAY86_003102 [Trapa natans]|uniref:UBP-type domain-containing protein n=1 Tax=Trapa natans TaxID=22666 RepID=A0AAN7LSJ2_TRANT|nr:hypothetical protein SAY86_003102 [Trapa natans]
MDDLYSVLISFDSQVTTDVFYKYYNGRRFNSLEETQHCYSLELETQRVWDYVGENYVQQPIQSKTDGKLVALNSNDGCGSFEDLEMSEALINRKVEAIVNGYNDLATQPKIAVEKAITKKLQKQQTKLDICMKEKKLLKQIGCIACVAFETARKRRGKLCSVDKANVLEVRIFALCYLVSSSSPTCIFHSCAIILGE